MSLGDPFGRVARRRTAAYTQLREELQRQGIRSGADIERVVARMNRTTLRLMLLLLVAAATMIALWPQWRPALVLFAVLFAFWIGSSYLQTRNQLRRFGEEMSSTGARTDPDQAPSTTRDPDR